MNSKKKIAFGMILFAAFLVAAYLGYNALVSRFKPAAQAVQSSSAQEKKKVMTPDFTVYDAKGHQVRLSDFKGKPVVLNFWASWCSPCKSEMPHFNQQYANQKNNVVFLMVNMTDGERETQAKAQKYVREQGFSFPIYFDKELQASNTYGISSIPDTLFIDSQGVIVNAYQGAIDEETLISGIKSIQ